jgi:molybdenum cofactor biosynthesis protein B
MDHDKRIDKSVPFVAVNIAVLTVSDSRSLDDDRSGDVLVGRVADDGHNLADRRIVTDDFDVITAIVKNWVDDALVDVVIATGGTGLTGRDGTPEAFRFIFEKEIEGFGEIFRYVSFQKIGTSTIQSRAVAGVAGGTYLFALPGSPSACRDAWDDILRYQLDIRHRPCNFVEIMPRLTESAVTRRGGKCPT